MEDQPGDELRFGTHGLVAGRSCVGDGGRLAVLFPQRKDAEAVRLALFSREPPVLSGSYKVGDRFCVVGGVVVCRCLSLHVRVAGERIR